MVIHRFFRCAFRGKNCRRFFIIRRWSATRKSSAPPKPVSAEDLEGYSCSAGHSFCYISPYGDVFPCVQFPLPTGNIREQKFLDIWNFSPEMKEVRSIQAKDLTVCSSCTHVTTCTRCPGLAYMEGNMRSPST